MAVRPGYKRTDVGIIPAEWEVISLERLSDSKRPICYGIVQVGPFTEGGIPVLAIKNLNTDYVTAVHKSRPAIEKPYARSRVKCGDILISVKGTVGRIGLVPEHYAGNISRDLARLAPTESDVPEYWFHLLQSAGARRRLDVATVGTTRLELSIGTLKQLSMPRAPREEQRAVAQVLHDVDAALKALDAVLTKRRDLKRAAMHELLTGQTRLPGCHGQWDIKRLGEVAHIKTGSRNNDEKVEDGAYPFFVRSETVERINTYSHDCEAVLVPGEGRIGSVFHHIVGRFDVHQRVYAITRFSPDVFGKFVYFYMVKSFGSYAMQNTVKATVDSLRLPTFQKFEMTLPASRDEQIKIAEVLSDMDSEIAALQARRDKTRLLKQALMQELLTGRTRLV